MFQLACGGLVFATSANWSKMTGRAFPTDLVFVNNMTFPVRFPWRAAWSDHERGWNISFNHSACSPGSFWQGVIAEKTVLTLYNLAW